MSSHCPAELGKGWSRREIFTEKRDWPNIIGTYDHFVSEYLYRSKFMSYLNLMIVIYISYLFYDFVIKIVNLVHLVNTEQVQTTANY